MSWIIFIVCWRKVFFLVFLGEEGLVEVFVSGVSRVIDFLDFYFKKFIL